MTTNFLQISKNPSKVVLTFKQNVCLRCLFSPVYSTVCMREGGREGGGVGGGGGGEREREHQNETEDEPTLHPHHTFNIN